MRRMVSVILTVAFMLGAFAASAEGTGALDAFAALTGQQAQIHGSRRDGPRVAVSFGYQHA